MNRAQRRTVKKKTSRLRIPSINEFDMLTDTQQMKVIKKLSPKLNLVSLQNMTKEKK
jgi:hypothetical protein